MAAVRDTDEASSVDAIVAPPPASGPAAAFARSIRTLRTAARNPEIARVVIAFGAFTIAEWAVWIAMLVYAFDRGGAAGSGIAALVQLLPAGILAPVLSGLAERLPRERVLVLALGAQSIAMAVTAAALFLDAPIFVVYILAAAATVAITVSRPAHDALLPWLARTPEELTMANVATGTIGNISILIAPAAAGAILATSGAWVVFGASAAIVGGAAVLVGGIRTERSTVARRRPGGAAGDEIGIAEGLRILLRNHAGSRTIVVLIAIGSVMEGALDLVAVVLALDILDIGNAGVGILTSAVGAGGLVGAALAAGLVGRSRLGIPFEIGLALWGVPIVIVGIAPSVAVAVLMFVVAGVARSIVDVAGRTLLQRVAPDAALNAIFGALEGLRVIMLAIGSVAVPALILLVGSRWGLILAGIWLPVVVVITARAVARADDHGVVHIRELHLLRALPIFAALAPPTIERLAAHLEPVTADAGRPIVIEGQPGDRFYLIEKGRASVSVGERQIRELGPGDAFGEIALLLDVPRTATVESITPVSLYSLERSVFLTALGAESMARHVADDLVSARLAADEDIDAERARRR
jgi:MFS family permease